MRYLTPRPQQTGFSLLELALTMGVVGTVLTGLWQLMGMSGQVRDAAALASQAQTVAAAGQQYINSQRTTLLALGGLATLNSTVRIKILDGDTGDTATSVVGLGFLPSGFINQNSYGQSYQLYVRREDAGTIGAADDGDSLIGLLVSTGGSAIPDPLGARLSGFLGAAGGFLYSENNPAAPTAATDARGTNGGWAVALTATGWSSIGANAAAGRIAVLTNLVPQNASGAGNGSAAGGASAIDDLSDGTTDYTTKYNVFLGEDAGASNSTGIQNTALGWSALKNNSTGSYNTAMGYKAGFDTGGSNNVAIGYEAYNGTYWGGNTSGSGNTAIGNQSMAGLAAESNNTAVGHAAMCSGYGEDVTAIGAYALYSACSSFTLTGSTVVGAGAWSQGEYNAVVGTETGSYNGSLQGSYNSVLGYEAIYYAFGANYNVALGYRAGNNGFANFTGANNIAIGASSVIPNPALNNQLNIGNYIYGNLSTKQINLGSSALTTDIAFDVGSKTSAGRLAKGTTAQRPTCDVSLVGAQRWNSETKSAEICNSNEWMQIHIYGAGSGDPNVTGMGYIVATAGRWDGNLGGMSGADAKCLSDLSTYDWKGKATAVANGKLIAGNVKAILWGAGWSCDDWNFSLVPGAAYAYAVSNKPMMGGAVTIAPGAYDYPPNKADWTAANYLDGQFAFWARSGSCSSSTACSNWTSNSAAQVGMLGTPGAAEPRIGTNPVYAQQADGRTFAYSDSCDKQFQLLCLVGP
jgi:type II secretory pathway pseudopilin PulG